MSRTDPLAGAVVIATRDRPDDLRRCLASLLTQTESAAEVIVVDASVGTESEECALRARAAGLPLSYRRASPSLTRQRAEGVRASSSPVVHFLDDDVELESGYLAAIHDEYRADPGVLGVGGLPSNLPAFAPGPLRRLLLPRSTNQGVVLPSGRGVLVYSADRPVVVDWLSGCCMSFRRTALEAEPFDETQSGYVLGEDVDIGYRIRQHGVLKVTPRARLVHHESPVNRMGWKEWAALEVVNRHRRVARRTGDLRMHRFWASVVGQTVAYALMGVRPAGGKVRQMAIGSLLGAARIIRSDGEGGAAASG